MIDVWTKVGIVPGIGLIALDNRFQLTLVFAEQLGMQGWEILDPVIAISVAIDILWAGLHLLLRTISRLMGATLPGEELAEIVGYWNNLSLRIKLPTLLCAPAMPARDVSCRCMYWCRGNGLYSKAMICWKP